MCTLDVPRKIPREEFFVTIRTWFVLEGRSPVSHEMVFEVLNFVGSLSADWALEPRLLVVRESVSEIFPHALGKIKKREGNRPFLINLSFNLKFNLNIDVTQWTRQDTLGLFFEV